MYLVPRLPFQHRTKPTRLLDRYLKRIMLSMKVIRVEREDRRYSGYLDRKLAVINKTEPSAKS